MSLQNIMTEFNDLDFEEIMDNNFSIVAEEIDFTNLRETSANKEQKIFPILSVRNMVMFPKVVIPITAGRDMSIQLLEEAHKNN